MEKSTKNRKILPKIPNLVVSKSKSLKDDFLQIYLTKKNPEKIKISLNGRS